MGINEHSQNPKSGLRHRKPAFKSIFFCALFIAIILGGIAILRHVNTPSQGEVSNPLPDYTATHTEETDFREIEMSALSISVPQSYQQTKTPTSIGGSVLDHRLLTTTTNAQEGRGQIGITIKQNGGALSEESSYAHYNKQNNFTKVVKSMNGSELTLFVSEAKDQQIAFMSAKQYIAIIAFTISTNNPEKNVKDFNKVVESVRWK